MVIRSWAQTARGVSTDRVDGVRTAGRASWERVVLDIRAHFRFTRTSSVLFLVFQGPLMLARLDLAEVVDACVFLGGIARPNEVRNGNRGQQTDDGNHDHDFHEREA